MHMQTFVTKCEFKSKTQVAKEHTMTYEEEIDALFENARKNIYANIDAETEKFREEFNKSIDDAINKELSKLNPLNWFKRNAK